MKSSIWSVLALAAAASCASWPGSKASTQRSLVKRDGSPLPSPIQLTPSQYWDGDDGRWSTFEFEVGTPPQQIRLLPGTSTSTVYYIAPQGCSADANPPDTNDCPQMRGGIFNPNASSTWALEGSYQYQGNYSQSSLLGYFAASQMGTDSVTLGWPGGPNLTTIPNQFIGGLLEKSIWYIGNFGLFPRPVNLTEISNTQKSVMENLRSMNAIPSTSWAYTAGFQAAQLPTFGSLTLGGYDTTRFRPNNGMTVPFGPDQTRDLLIAIQSISSTSGANSAGGLLPNPIYAYIDSTIPAIWLPLEACRAFEQAFNLTWYENSQYYLLTDEQHSDLLSRNPSVTFSLGANLAGGQTVQVTLPYAAFDLQLTSPMATQPTNYFPLQRAANNTQYVLGRTFLQQAYVIADYDRNNFTVAQALFPQNVKPDIVTIYPPGYNASSSSSSQGLSAGAIAGIVIGIVALLGLLALALFFVRRSRKAKSSRGTTASQSDTGPSMGAPSTAGESSDLTSFRPPISHHPSSQPPEYGTQSPYEKAELHAEESPFRDGAGLLGYGAAKTAELEGHERRHELGETRAKRAEMDGGQTLAEMEAGAEGKRKTKGGEVYEMPG